MKTLSLTISTQQDLEREIAGFLRQPAERRELRIVPMRGAVDLAAWLEPIGQESCMVCGDDERRFLTLEEQAKTKVTELTGDALCPECGAMREFVSEPGKLHRVTVAGGSEPLHPQWVRDVRDACVAASVEFCFESWGSWQPIEKCRDSLFMWEGDRFHKIDGQAFCLVGSSRSGRMLDGRTWEGKP